MDPQPNSPEEIMKHLLLSAWILFVAVSAEAQERMIPIEPPPPPALMVQMDGKTRPIELSRVDTQVTVTGFVAEIRTTMTFYNPHGRNLAGDLYFPLPEGTTISGYALDVGGVMVDGVAVEKTEARQIFEAEVRKGIDPGLVEWTQGNSFKTRVFPIPPNGTRTVMVRYLTQVFLDNGVPSLSLPMAYRDTVKEFHLRVEVIKPSAPPVIRQGKLANFAFGAVRDSYIAETTLRNQTITETLVMGLPDVEKDRVRVEKAADNEVYFVIHDLPPAAPQGGETKPRHLGILWDASGSRSLKSIDRELGVLALYLKGLGVEDLVVDVVAFRNDPDSAVTYHVKNGDATRLLESLRAIPLDGGTQMGRLLPDGYKGKVDLFLLFSDGLSTIGKDMPEQFNVPVTILSNEPTANHGFLRFLAGHTGGSYLNLATMTDEEAVARIGVATYALQRISVDEGKVDGLCPGGVTAVRGPMAVLGKLKSRDATISLHYGVGGKTSQTVTYALSESSSGQGELVRAFWATRQVDELAMQPEKNHDELVRLGKEYGLVTPGTSLLVLETLEQYVEHRVMPPATLPDMRRAWVQRIEEDERVKKEERQNKLEQMVSLWNQRVQWWNTEFKVPKVVEKVEAKPTAMRDEAEEQSARSASPMMEMRGSGMGAGGASMERERRMDAPGGAKKAKGKDGDDDAVEVPPAPTIELANWNPDTPYLKKLSGVNKLGRYATYLTLRPEYATSPSFFLDCANVFFTDGETRLALRVLSNIAEMDLENPALLRILAHRLAQQGELALARGVFEKVLKLRPDEPQSYRDLAAVLDQMEDYRQAVKLLYHVVLNDWERFAEIELIALMEMNRVIARANRQGVKKFDVDPRLVKLLDLDIRIQLTWDADLTDMDLWVFEPTGEKAYYGNNRTQAGGLVSRDFTQGYGPEEYLIHKAVRGTYKMQANYYGSSGPTLTGPVTLQLDIFTNYGRTNEERKTVTLRLEGVKDVIDICEIKF